MDRLWWVLAIAFLAAPAAAAPAPVATWFDAATARELMDARREFDAAELEAIAAFEQAVGGEPRRAWRFPSSSTLDQAASPALRQIRWSENQRRRSGAAMPVRLAAVDAAEHGLQRRTLAALQRFFVQERAAGRITPAAYERVAGGELRANYFPSIRRRKWAGPAVTGFRQEIRTAAYRQVLAEVRKLWSAQAAGGEVVPASKSHPAW